MWRWHHERKFQFKFFINNSYCFHHRLCSSNRIKNNNSTKCIDLKKIPKNVAVIFSSEMPTYVDSVRPSSYLGSAHTYNFELGKALCSALHRSVETVYENATLTKSIQPQDKYDRIIKFSLADSNIDVYFQEGFLTPTARASFSISVTIEAYDGSGKILRKTTVNGNGFSSKNADAFSANKVFAAAAESAIQQVADNVANLLISGFAE